MTNSNSVPSGRTALHVETLGDGMPVVFLHAAVADRRMWSRQMPGVAQHAKAIAYDRRGFGKTQYEAEDYSSVADLIALLDVLGDGKPAILVGCSQGGRVALDAALEHPSRFAGLALIAPNVPGAPEPNNPPEIAQMLADQQAALDAGDIDRVNIIKAHLWLDGPLMPEGRVSGEARELLIEMNGSVLRAPSAGTDQDVTRIPPAYDRLVDLQIPALMIWGDLDFPFIVERSRMAAAKIGNCTCLELGGTAHLPSLDAPDAVTSALVEFVTQHSS